jgi:hypothetical protein
MDDDVIPQKRGKKPAKEKKPPPPDTRTNAEKEIDEAVGRSKIKTEKDKARKKNFLRGFYLVLGVLLSYGIYLLFVPYKGTMPFGICKVFLELNVPYPHTLRLSSVEEFSTSVRIWYADIDSFGEYRLEPIQCYFKAGPNAAVPYVLDKVAINRRELDPQKVADFNRSVPGIFASPPDLTLPGALPDSLAALQFNADRFRIIISNRKY